MKNIVELDSTLGYTILVSKEMLADKEFINQLCFGDNSVPMARLREDYSDLIAECEGLSQEEARHKIKVCLSREDLPNSVSKAREHAIMHICFPDLEED